VVKTALLCLALNSYRETRGEEVAAQIAAMKILQNRAELNHTTVCQEVAKHKQFAWVRKYGITDPKPHGQIDKAAWIQAKQLAKSVLVNDVIVKGITPKHTFFNEARMGKRYKTKTKVKRIGKMLFY
jgi:spore germination cell wall hydrolase CwlJ-like protein